MLGLYLYASGAQRQTITVLSMLGITESYTNIVTQKERRQHEKKASAEPQDKSTSRPATINSNTAPPATSESIPLSRYSGTLRQLSDSMRARARQIAATGLYSIVYDNINIMFRSPEQIIGRHGASSILPAA